MECAKNDLASGAAGYKHQANQGPLEVEVRRPLPTPYPNPSADAIVLNSATNPKPGGLLDIYRVCLPLPDHLGL